MVFFCIADKLLSRPWLVLTDREFGSLLFESLSIHKYMYITIHAQEVHDMYKCSTEDYKGSEEQGKFPHISYRCDMVSPLKWY